VYRNRRCGRGDDEKLSFAQRDYAILHSVAGLFQNHVHNFRRDMNPAHYRNHTMQLFLLSLWPLLTFCTMVPFCKKIQFLYSLPFTASVKQEE
jgi:hypothetical protein